MAAAADELEFFRTAGLTTVDPDIAALLGPRARPAARSDRADRVGELHVAVGHRGGRLRADQQVRRGLPREAVLRRLRGRRRDRDDRDRPGEVALRRRARERAAARRRTGEHGGLPRATRAGRHRARVAPRPRRASHAWAQGQLLRSQLQRRPVRRLPRDERGRGGGSARARARASAQADPLRRLCVLPGRRHEDVPSRCRRGRRAPLVRHGALLGARRRRPAPEPRRGLRRRHLDDAQDARRARAPGSSSVGTSTRRRSIARSSPACRVGR